jgi:succinate dehydrogenase flavin-adding protein (antitoxin of CptAB toxin-antitoxin module)
VFEKDKPTYMTRAIANELDKELQQFILRYIDENGEQLTDYLQIFEFYIENNQQWLVQRQEEPNRETTILINLNDSEPIDRKVWAMDQGDHVMVLFPEDY